MSSAPPEASESALRGAAWTDQPAVFQVHLDNFEGPFDLLLNLIAKHRLDVTEVALSQVTDEFIEYIRSAGEAWDLGAATEFLVVAATLLDIKTARLLPAVEVDEDEDLSLVEARDLLFARLLQYRAYKQAATHLAALERAQFRRFARIAALEPRFAAVRPEVSIDITVDELAGLAAQALRPRPVPTVAVAHLHTARVSVGEHALIVRLRLAAAGSATFRSLIADCRSTLEVVARFLALLELHREGVVAFEQVIAMGELHVRWTGDRPAALSDQSGPAEAAR
ncbi:MAG: segregation/condensation protein A [Actinomycetota bacterium]|nr:segregation/condensation protein A [Actinomycetota bacterium]